MVARILEGLGEIRQFLKQTNALVGIDIQRHH